MVHTKHVIAQQLTEGIPIEETSSSGEEMEAPLEVESFGESTAEETAAEEEASRRHGRKVPEGRVSFKNLLLLLIKQFR